MKEHDESPAREKSTSERSEFLDALRKGVLIGLGALVVILPPVIVHRRHAQPSAPPAAVSQQAPRNAPIHRFASFGAEAPSPDVVRIANWVADSGDNARHSFVVVDKAGAKVYAFDPDAHLLSAVPAVLGMSHGDDTPPGVADIPVDDIPVEQQTTPAGRFVAEVGESASRHEDVIWVDYNAAVSMHRVIPSPRRLAALETPDPSDNRLSHGCINVPVNFYEGVLRPAVDRTGVVFYVLPEQKSLKATFAGFYEAGTTQGPAELAQR